MKPEPHRLDLASYRYTTVIEPRFGDMDALRHLNNVALAGIYEEARLRYTSGFNHGPIGDERARPVLAEVRIRYLAEGRYPGPLTVGVGVIKLGTSSYVIGQALFQDGACIGISDVVVVWTEHGKPAPLPEKFRAALEAALIALPADADA
jgi:acyl-CoA thioester hydrolase